MGNYDDDNQEYDPREDLEMMFDEDAFADVPAKGFRNQRVMLLVHRGKSYLRF